MKFSLFLILCLTSCAINPFNKKNPLQDEKLDIGRIYPIPKNAEISILASTLKNDLQDKDCEDQIKNEKMSREADVRFAFDTYKVIDPPTMHYKYIWVECMTTGTIFFNDITYEWKWRIGNLLETDFPDGIYKILGGQFSDDVE